MKIKVMSFITAVLLAVLILLTSCGDDGNPIDGTSPNIQTLTTNTAFIGQAIIIKGANFGTSQGSGYVSLNGEKLDDTSHYSWSDTRIVIIIPSWAVTGGVEVNANGMTSNSVNLTVNALPESSSPFIDYLSQDIAQPRQTISIYGKNFGNLKGSVEFKGAKVEDNDITFWGATRISVKVPDEALTGKIVAFTYDSTGTNTAEFRVQNPNPIVDMVKIDTGTFVMGSDNSSLANISWCSPAHNVQITKAFYIGKYEVSQKEYEEVMNGSNPSREKGDSYPVDGVTWLNAVRFCNLASKMENFDTCYTINGNDATCDFNADGYRLPTEAEWEYACRAGTTSLYAGNIDELSWNNENTPSNDGKPKHPQNVGTKKPNDWGIYDMHGNVYEWCWDWYDAGFYEQRPNPDVDPTGPSITDDKQKVYRGGSYSHGLLYSASAFREGRNISSANFDLGFRVVRKAKN
ncbi:MAG: hypothetical protein A2X61_01975 [Ignavibacteria bacterium GWB2_35_12]|nr:MAG: hypothetical protein A2X63_01290 [Ignavibacteria bacterium GWA2_35_8]OGU40020.1 MAG: hypothetical protein A2X61_01975 [Ignavibacteria bacterium GWB2_35_12]OGU86924.1 MAG: hypothetical protein A2220_12360 [Ignavibacteria bacterium RIFOXYA2_FULL_35_10]OGV21966.1 MAG: hypothetical protein A2475_08045 [Ignavibacteria bacterium RIFOXYC2_FULL_35_21]